MYDSSNSTEYKSSQSQVRRRKRTCLPVGGQQRMRVSWWLGWAEWTCCFARIRCFVWYVHTGQWYCFSWTINLRLRTGFSPIFRLQKWGRETINMFLALDLIDFFHPHETIQLSSIPECDSADARPWRSPTAAPSSRRCTGGTAPCISDLSRMDYKNHKI